MPPAASAPVPGPSPRLPLAPLAAVTLLLPLLLLTAAPAAAAHPVTRPPAHPPAHPSARLAGQPAVRLAGQPSGRSSTHPSARLAGQPAVRLAGQPSGRSSTHPAGQPSARPSAGSAGWALAPVGGWRPAFYAEGAPGAVLQDTVSVTNRGRSPLAVRLHGTGMPVTLARTALTVPARTRAEVPFTVTVPQGTPPGDRSGAIVARDAHGRTASVPVRLRVRGPALAALTVEHLAVHADRITYELVNRGTTVLVPRLAVRADGLFGRVLDRGPRTLPVRLPPGARRTLSEPWPERPVLDEVRVRLTVTAAGDAHDTAATSAAYVPWGALAAAAAAAAGTATLLHRRHTHRTPPASAPPASAPGLVESTGVGV